jgi:hypothetical protein
MKVYSRGSRERMSERGNRGLSKAAKVGLKRLKNLRAD